eukprot:PLAT1498.1.p1 GENE.PLAT1498.1~~PLAT1498.1.p1  ORF type:complete len:464 (-),score=232.14 PLAT1498.1:43-1434(-)
MSYSFSAAPRAVGGKRRKYRTAAAPDPAASRKMENLMWDPRVRRGNTYSGTGVALAATIAAATEPAPREVAAPARSPSKERERERRAKEIYELRPETERFVELDLTPYLVEAVEETPEVEVSTQTDRFLPRKPVKTFVPAKTGIDASTQIEAADGLFDFDMEVEPILDVICGKTLEQALMEVEEEEELAALAERKTELLADKAAARAAARAKEEAEVRRWKAKEAAKSAARARVEREKRVIDKLAAVATTRRHFAHLHDSVFSRLSTLGFFYDRTRADIEDNFMPWLLGAVADRVTAKAAARSLLEGGLRAGLHEQRRQAAAQWLQKLAEARAAQLAKEAKEAAARLMAGGSLHISVVDGEVISAQLTRAAGDDGELTDAVIEAVEARVADWLRETVEGVRLPDTGVLRLALRDRGAAAAAAEAAAAAAAEAIASADLDEEEAAAALAKKEVHAMNLDMTTIA